VAHDLEVTAMETVTNTKTCILIFLIWYSGIVLMFIHCWQNILLTMYSTEQVIHCKQSPLLTSINS